MNCNQTRKYLSAFLDSELDVRTNIEVLEHVEICRDCARKLDRQRTLRDAVSGYIASVEAPASLRARVKGALAEAAAGRSRLAGTAAEYASKGWVRAFAAAASILVVFALVYQVLLAPSTGVNAATMREHAAVLRDRVATFMYTENAERARKVATFKMSEKPVIPLADGESFSLVGAGPVEIQLRDVGHFVFRYKAEMVSLFVFEGLGIDAVSGRTVMTGLGEARADESGGVSLVAWRGGHFTYILVSRLSEDVLLNEVGPSLLKK
jgi:anti-sigma factor RsiW